MTSKTKIASTGIACLLLLASASAYAGTYTTSAEILRVEGYGEGLRVLTTDDNNDTNPANCQGSDWINPSSGLSDIRKDRLHRIILSAFLSGREVRIKLHDGECVNGNRAYYAVQIK